MQLAFQEVNELTILLQLHSVTGILYLGKVQSSQHSVTTRTKTHHDDLFYHLWLKSTATSRVAFGHSGIKWVHWKENQDKSRGLRLEFKCTDEV